MRGREDDWAAARPAPARRARACRGKRYCAGELCGVRARGRAMSGETADTKHPAKGSSGARCQRTPETAVQARILPSGSVNLCVPSSCPGKRCSLLWPFHHSAPRAPSMGKLPSDGWGDTHTARSRSCLCRWTELQPVLWPWRGCERRRTLDERRGRSAAAETSDSGRAGLEWVAGRHAAVALVPLAWPFHGTSERGEREKLSASERLGRSARPTPPTLAARAE